MNLANSISDLKINEQQDEFTDADFLLNELKQMKESFKDIPQKELHNLMKYQLRDDVKDIIELYDKEIEPLPKNDLVKLEITNIMLYLGINPFKNNDKYSTLNIQELIKEYD